MAFGIFEEGNFEKSRKIRGIWILKIQKFIQFLFNFRNVLHLIETKFRMAALILTELL